ncbi:MAG: hypothetical protein ACI9QD_000739 [Thermoproteota archaeon]|jgi:hypothetical protein
MKLLLIALLMTSFCMSGQSLAAGKHAGILVRKSGAVELFLHPSKSVQGKGAHALFQGLYYTVKKNPRLGFKIPNGTVIKTGRKSKARIVYKNGDQFNVGEGTSYKIVSVVSKKSKKGSTTVNLLYGKLRAIISKKGPRNNMKIKTNTAVMGIRGTDFYVNKTSSLKGAEVTVLRGMVEIKPKNKKLKTVKIQKGFTAKAPKPKRIIKRKKSKLAAKIKQEVEVLEEVKVLITSKQELIVIQTQSVIKKEEMSKKDKIATKKIAKILEKLEKKAVENTLDDIKVYDPDLYKKLKKDKVASVDVINTTVVKKMFKKAPDRPLKPGLENLGDDDVYERYFVIE